MKKVWEFSRNDANMVLTLIKANKAPNAFILGKVEKFLETYLHLFAGPKFRITIETIAANEHLPEAETLSKVLTG